LIIQSLKISRQNELMKGIAKRKALVRYMSV